MRLKSLLFVICMSFVTSIFATSVHQHPKANLQEKSAKAQSVKKLGSCDIVIINRSYMDLYVQGTFDDYTSIGFPIYRYDGPHIIDMYYDYYCHPYMDLLITSPYGVVFQTTARVGSSIFIEPYLANQVKVKVTNK